MSNSDLSDALRIVERLISVDVQSMMRSIDRSATDTFAAPRLPDAVVWASRLSALQHDWSEALRISLLQIQAHRTLLSSRFAATPREVASAASRGASLSRGYAAFAGAVEALLLALRQGDEEAVETAGREVEALAAPPRAAGDPTLDGVGDTVHAPPAPPPETPADPPETPRERAAREQRERQEREALEREERERAARLINQIGDGLTDALDDAFGAEQGAANARAEAARNNLRRMASEADRALEAQSRRTIVSGPTTTPRPSEIAQLDTAPPEPTRPPTRQDGSVWNSKPVRYALAGTMTTAAVAIVAIVVVSRREAPPGFYR